jgi:hypothetical protein
MFKKIRDFLWHRKMAALPPDEAIQKVGHRDYVGGKWDEIGRLQFDFMRSRGLQPEDVLLDIACGSLRAGIHFIHYLLPGHYLGIEKEQALVSAGIDQELGRSTYQEKSPELIVSGSFEFEKFSKKPSYALAHALFTHLTAKDLENCMAKLHAFVIPGCRFYVTFFESRGEAKNASASHDHTFFKYTREQMIQFGERNGWKAVYLGDWKHPRQQMMMEYTAR